MALFGRKTLLHRATLSRFLAAVDQSTVEALPSLFLEDLVVLPSTVRSIRLKHGIFHTRSQSHPRGIEGALTISQIATTLDIDPHWIYDRIHNGTIQVDKDPKTRLFLFSDEPETIEQFKHLCAGQFQHVRFSTGASRCMIEG